MEDHCKFRLKDYKGSKIIAGTHYVTDKIFLLHGVDHNRQYDSGNQIHSQAC